MEPVTLHRTALREAQTYHFQSTSASSNYIFFTTITHIIYGEHVIKTKSVDLQTQGETSRCLMQKWHLKRIFCEVAEQIRTFIFQSASIHAPVGVYSGVRRKFSWGGFIQWHRVVICILCALIVTSQFDVIVLFPNQRFGEVC